MKNLHFSTKGLKSGLHGGNYPICGMFFYGLLHDILTLKNYQYTVSLTSSGVVDYMVHGVSNFNTYNNFNHKELPARMVASAHRSGHGDRTMKVRM